MRPGCGKERQEKKPGGNADRCENKGVVKKSNSEDAENKGVKNR
jgi:hypothetical protein